MSEQKENKVKWNSNWLCIAFPLGPDREGNPREGYASADFRFLDKDTPDSRAFKEKQVALLEEFVKDPGKIEVKEEHGKWRFVITTGSGLERNLEWAKKNNPRPESTTRRSI